jgi:hypothetical protein
MIYGMIWYIWYIWYDIWYNIWYDTIRYDMIYDMIYIFFYTFIGMLHYIILVILHAVTFGVYSLYSFFTLLTPEWWYDICDMIYMILCDVMWYMWYDMTWYDMIYLTAIG